MQQDYKYQLEKPGSKRTCPSCERRNEFTCYVNRQGEIIDETCGRCNRENNCGYHLPPREYFKMHPERRQELERNEHTTPIYIPKPKPPQPIGYLPTTLLNDISQCLPDNNLYRYLITLFPQEQVDNVFRLYHVGTARHWKLKEGYTTVFPQVDEQGRLHQLKLMLYDPHTGKRVKSNEGVEVWNSYYNDYTSSDGTGFIYFKGRDLLEDKNRQLQQTFFGCHLIPQSHSTIGLVESEKTALICSLCLPQYTWISTGGSNGCKWNTPEVSAPLKGRKVVLLPDSGVEQKWNERATTLKTFGIDAHVYPFCCGTPTNTDAADLLLEERKKMKNNPTNSTERGQQEIGMS